MENSKFEFFQKHKLENPHTIVGGMHETRGGGLMAGHGDTFYCQDEGPKTGKLTLHVGEHAGETGDVIFASPDGGDGEVDYETYEVDWWFDDL